MSFKGIKIFFIIVCLIHVVAAIFKSIISYWALILVPFLLLTIPTNWWYFFKNGWHKFLYILSILIFVMGGLFLIGAEGTQYTNFILIIAIVVSIYSLTGENRKEIEADNYWHNRITWYCSACGQDLGFYSRAYMKNVSNIPTCPRCGCNRPIDKDPGVKLPYYN